MRFAGLFAAAACAATLPTTPTATDEVLVPSRIHTLDPARSTVEALLNGKVARVEAGLHRQPGHRDANGC
jgi:hypothetical protein